MATPNPFDAILFGQAEDEDEGLTPDLVSEATAPDEPTQPEAPKANPFDSILFGQTEAPPESEAPPPEEKGTIANLWAGLKERGTELAANLPGGIQTYGQALEGEDSWVPSAGGIVHSGGLDFEYLSPEEWKKYSEDGGRMGLRELQEEWASVSHGFTPNAAENWEILKGEAGLWEKAQAAGAFALETGVISLADMAGAVLVPPAYIMSRAEEIAQERAVQAGRPGKPNNDDLKISLGAAMLIQAMERFGFERIADAWTKGGPALKRILTAGMAEAGTEAVQEPLEFAAETYGTQAEEAMTPEQYRLAALERSAQGALGGGPVGAVLATPGAMMDRGATPDPDADIISPDVKSLEENKGAIDQALAEQADADQLTAGEDARTAMSEWETEQIELKTREYDLQQKTYPSMFHAQLELKRMGKQDSNLVAIKDLDGQWVLRTRSMADAIRLQHESNARNVGLYPAEGPQMEVTEGAEEIDIGEPAPTTEGIEVTEIPEEQLEAIPQIGVSEVVADEEITLKGNKIYQTQQPAETEAKRVKGEVGDLSTKNLKMTLRDAGMKQAGTREEMIERITTGREAIEAIGKKYGSQREILDAVESGEINRADLFRFARAVSPGNMKVDEMGTWQNGRNLSGWLNRVMGEDGPTPMSDSDWAQWRREKDAEKAEKGKAEVESQLAMVEKHLADMPANIDAMSDEGPAQTERIQFLQKRRRELLDARDHGLATEEAKTERARLRKEAYDRKIPIGRLDSITDMRKKLDVEELPESFALYDNIPKEVTDFATGFMAKTEPHPDNPNMRVVDGVATLEIEPFGENESSVMWNSVEAMEPGKGGGKAALEFLLELADEHNVSIVTEPNVGTTDGTGLNQEQLVKWLEDNGFGLMEDYDDLMVYKPGKNAEPDTKPVVEPETASEQTQTDDAGERRGEFLKDLNEFIDSPDTPSTTSTDVLPDGTEYDLSHTKDTQVPNTVGTYDKAKAEYLADIDNGDILDYGAGMGLASRKHGFESLEPYPTGWEPDYFTADQIDRQYDGIILNNILNVLPKHTRHVVLADAAKRKLAPGGRMYINVRSRGDVMGQRDTAKKVFSESEILTQRDTYQKGYQRPELIKYLQRELGPDYTVESAKFGSIAVTVTKKGGETKATPTKEATQPTQPSLLDLVKQVEAPAEAKKASRDPLAEATSDHEVVGKRVTISDRFKGDERYRGATGTITGKLLGYPAAEIQFDDEALNDKGDAFGLNTLDDAAPAEEQVALEEEHATEEVEPTGEASAAAEEFSAAHPEFKGLILSFKPGDDRNGNPVSDYYGEKANTKDADGMPTDVVLNKNFKAKAKTRAFIINQKDPKTGEFRQHKVMAGFATEALAKKSYNNMWGEEGFDSVYSLTAEDLDLWWKHGDQEATFKPLPWRQKLKQVRKDQRKGDFEQFRKDLANKSETYSQSNKKNQAAQVAPDATKDDAVTFLRKLGGLDMISQSDVPKGRLKHLNQLDMTPGLWSVEQETGGGLSLSQATEQLWQAGYITENDESQTIDLLYESESTPQYTPEGYEAQTQREMDAEYEEQEAEYWAEFVENNPEYSQVDPETSRLMKLASEVDQDQADDILAKDIPEADVQAQLRELANVEQQTEARADDTAKSADEAIQTDERESEAADLTIPQRDWDQIVNHWESLFDVPGERVRHTTNKEYITQAEADQTRQEWYAEVDRQLKEHGAENAQKGIVLSLFDRTGVWAQPWAEAGYDVRLIDMETDGTDIMDIDAEWLIDNGMEDAYIVLAACPCTDFASAGARWMKDKDASGQTQKSVDLVNHTMEIISWLQPRFWTIENPVGRIGRMTNLPKNKEAAEPRLAFHPHNYGDPYTKQTLLWGNFNPDLPLSNVEPTEGSYAHNLRGDDPVQKAARSDTFEGFAYSFFMANNDQAKAPEYVRFREGVVDSFKDATPEQQDQIRLAYEVGVHNGLTEDQAESLSGVAREAYDQGFNDWNDNWLINQDSKGLTDEEVDAKANELMSEKGASMIAQTPEEDLGWGEPKKQGPMTPKEVEGLPQPEEPSTERGPDWEPVDTPTLTTAEQTKAMAQVLTDSAKTPEGAVALKDIPLTAEDGDRKVTHNAKWWKNAIDKRIKALNKLRGCA